ncbi:hypothetical protein MMC07_008682 [Pseudocyphellaria aurata]|nr:hypothetical protein [Pseudocyphellaria aurata]
MSVFLNISTHHNSAESIYTELLHFLKGACRSDQFAPAVRSCVQHSCSGSNVQSILDDISSLCKAVSTGSTSRTVITNPTPTTTDPVIPALIPTTTDTAIPTLIPTTTDTVIPTPTPTTKLTTPTPKYPTPVPGVPTNSFAGNYTRTNGTGQPLAYMPGSGGSEIRIVVRGFTCLVGIMGVFILS